MNNVEKIRQRFVFFFIVNSVFNNKLFETDSKKGKFIIFFVITFVSFVNFASIVNVSDFVNFVIFVNFINFANL